MKNGQVIRDLGGEHIAKSYGRCLVCNRITWGYADDPCPDWRGHFGNSTHCELHAEEYDMTGADITVCALCENTRQTYEMAIARAKTRWQPKTPVSLYD